MDMLKSNFTKRQLLKLLMESPDELISSKELALKTRISRQAIWKAVESLRSEGINIESVPQKGYRLTSDGAEPLSPSMISANIPEECTWGDDITLLDTIGSTQAYAREFARKDCPDGTVFISTRQEKGRGRRDRTWFSPPGGLYMSIVTRPKVEPSSLQLISLASALALRQALLETTSLSFDLKWPNDVLWDGKKLAGILSEASMEPDRIHYAIVGIGINVNIPGSLLPPELLSKSVSLEMILGNKVDFTGLASRIIYSLFREISQLESGNNEQFIRKYTSCCATLNREVEIHSGDGIEKGFATGISPRGELLVRIADMTMAFAAADVIHAPLCS